MANNRYDVIVVGGGFAGATAARQLNRAGFSVVVLEGRDRLGGRTWYKHDALPGRNLEMGGTWVHWFQPHVWAEISRYGLEVVESLGTSAPQRILTVRGDEQRWRSYEDAWPELEGLIDRFAGASREVLERPHDPLFRLAHVRALDGRTVQDRIDEMTDLDPAQRDLLNGMWSLCCSASCSAAGYVTMLRWYALSGWDAGLMFDAIARYKIKTGTSSLVEAIAHDSEAEIRLSTAVARIEHNELGATVITRAGDVFESDGVVVTAPLNTLGSIEFSPELPPGKALAVEQGQASRGLKVWLDVRGDLPDAFFAIAPEDHAINYVHTEDIVDGGQFLVGFGSDGALLDVENLQQVQPAAARLLGDIEVVQVTGHNWLDDEFSRGTWPVFRPGQASGTLSDLQKPEGRLFFAGSETANGWNGFIDGAIESGMRAGRLVSQTLGPRVSAAVA